MYGAVRGDSCQMSLVCSPNPKDSSTIGPLLLDDACNKDGSMVHDILYAKHTPSQPAMQDNTVSSTLDQENPHPVIFDNLCGSPIKSVVMSMEGTAGPS